MCEIASFKNFANSLTTVMMKTKVAPFYLGHGVYTPCPPKKHVTTFSTITLTIRVRLQ